MMIRLPVNRDQLSGVIDRLIFNQSDQNDIENDHLFAGYEPSKMAEETERRCIDSHLNFLRDALEEAIGETESKGISSKMVVNKNRHEAVDRAKNEVR